MAITATLTENPGRIEIIDGRFVRRGTLNVSGLSTGANTIPHGLGTVPQKVSLNPGAAGLWGTTQPADATNVYVTVGTGGATAGWINVWF